MKAYRNTLDFLQKSKADDEPIRFVGHQQLLKMNQAAMNGRPWSFQFFYKGGSTASLEKLFPQLEAVPLSSVTAQRLRGLLERRERVSPQTVDRQLDALAEQLDSELARRPDCTGLALHLETTELFWELTAEEIRDRIERAEQQLSPALEAA